MSNKDINQETQTNQELTESTESISDSSDESISESENPNNENNESEEYEKQIDKMIEKDLDKMIEKELNKQFQQSEVLLKKSVVGEYLMYLFTFCLFCFGIFCFIHFLPIKFISKEIVWKEYEQECCEEFHNLNHCSLEIKCNSMLYRYLKKLDNFDELKYRYRNECCYYFSRYDTYNLFSQKYCNKECLIKIVNLSKLPNLVK